METLDKALEMVQAATLQLVDTLKSAAPELWQMARARVYAEGAECIIIAILCLIVIAVAWTIRSKIVAKDPKDDDLYYVSGLISLGCTAIATVFFTVSLVDLVHYMIATDWYTAKMLLELLK